MTAAPYPADTRAKGWRFELDYEQIEQSGTWSAAMAAALDGLPLARPFLLAMWYAAWKQVPCGSLPADDVELAGAIGLPRAVFAEYRDVLLRGWWKADDGRLYHDTIAKRVLEMMGKRRSDSDRQAAKRAREALESAATHTEVTRDAAVTPTEVTRESSTDHRPPKTINTPPSEVAGPSLRVVPPSPPPDFDGKNAETLNGKSVVALSAGFELPEAWGFDAEALGFKPDEVLREAEKMRQWATVGKGAGTRRSVKGWRQTWSNWLGKAAERHQR